VLCSASVDSYATVDRMRQAVAYIRKSVVHKGDRILSAEVQEAKVRKLAERYGDTDLVILSDIGRSGRKKEKRPDYQRLLRMVDAGQVSAVYAYSLSRLNRSTRDYADFADRCVAQRVPVRLCHEGEQDFSTPTGRLIATILSGVAQMQAEIDSERASDVIRMRLANGEHHGEPPYGTHEGESLDAITDAYRVAGSLSGAARQLDEWGIPTRRGGRWTRGSIRKILAAQAPGTVPPGQVARAKGAPPFRLARLLKCHCGHILTGLMVKGHVRYRCADASAVAGHGKVSIAETHIIDWVRDEAGRLSMPPTVITEAESAERTTLEGRLERLSRQHEMGMIDDATLTVRAGEVQDALERLQAAEVMLDLDTDIDWENDSPEAVNAVLRSMWEHVEMGSDLLPVQASWRVPQWRGER
jgi:DNA invertase Pin-like site-specific DNA recombinase